MGFNHMTKERIREVARKGGSAKGKKGFANMDKERLREVSAKGGKKGRKKVNKNEE